MFIIEKREKNKKYNMPAYDMPGMQPEENSGFMTSLVDSLRNGMDFVSENRRRFNIYTLVCLAILVAFIISSILVSAGSNKLIKEESTLYTQNEIVKEEIRKHNVSYLEKIFVAEFEEEEINKMINNKFSYIFYVNSIKHTDATYTTDKNTVSIEIYESVPRDLRETFSDNLIRKASLFKEGQLPDFIQIVGSTSYKVNIIQQNYDRRYQIVFENIEVGNIISVMFKYSYAKRMGFSGNMLEIIRNQ